MGAGHSPPSFIFKLFDEKGIMLPSRSVITPASHYGTRNYVVIFFRAQNRLFFRITRLVSGFSCSISSLISSLAVYFMFDKRAQSLR